MSLIWSSDGEAPYLAGTCEACGNEFHTHMKSLRNTDLHSVGTCEICTKSFCSDCKYTCDCCDKQVCKGCTTRCAQCGEFTCHKCLTNTKCSYCAVDEDARLEAIAASNRKAYDSISQFNNGVWFCLAMLLLGTVVGLLWLYITRGWM